MVSRFDRAVLLTLAGKLAITLIVVVGLYLAIDLFESVRRFSTRPGVDFALIVGWDLLKLPSIFVQIAPLALLIAGVLAWHQLLTSGELTAWRSGGVGLIRLTRPFVVLALGLGLVNVAISDWVVPVSDPLMRQIANIKLGEHLPDDVDGDWLRMPDGTVYQLHHPPQSVLPTDLIRITFDGQWQPHDLVRAAIIELTPTGVVLGAGVHLHRAGANWLRDNPEGESLTLPASVRHMMERQFDPHRFSSLALAGQLVGNQLPESALLLVKKALWERGQILLLPAALVLLVPLIGGLNPRGGGAAWRVAAAIGAGFGFHSVEEIVRRIAEGGALHLGVAILGPTLVLILLLGWLLRRRDLRL